MVNLTLHEAILTSMTTQIIRVCDWTCKSRVHKNLYIHVQLEHCKVMKFVLNDSPKSIFDN